MMVGSFYALTGSSQNGERRPSASRMSSAVISGFIKIERSILSHYYLMGNLTVEILALKNQRLYAKLSRKYGAFDKNTLELLI